MRSSSADTNFGEEGGKGYAAGTGAQITVHPMKIMVKQIVSQDMEDYTGAHIHTTPVEDLMPE